ncbi:hypothetical protein FUA23_00240 [Neolewinella aurantiaca]|uniref:Uncharacterized protein n=1 Tax=Neolewinella aurantiaca TaxID=2602767 RepID=A0A5C7FYH7_9BACT|nr:hypothetical protein [Neolewinella aurantiaca]TXF91646.1 hypothetical protein FUA23_00240 [Neolewinella aurantiaca]
MILRYLVLFGGIVLMITGCNSLVSQNFGTHRLRTLDVTEADAQAIGEADFIEVAGAVMAKVAVTTSKKDFWGNTTVCRPLLSPGQQQSLNAGTAIETQLVVCFKTEDPACHEDPACLPYSGTRAIGLVGEPQDAEQLLAQLAQHQIRLKSPVVFLQLGEKPMAWYWNLLIFVGGICLAFIPEAIRHNRKASP